jgi:hypothetical protein
MSRIKQQVYWSILKMILYSSLIFNAIKGLVVGWLHEELVPDTFYLVLIMFLRSSMTTPVWRVGLKWTLPVSVAIESLMYGGGYLSFIVAALSAVKFLINYGFVLNWNPTLRKKDTLVNRMIEITLSSLIISIIAPLTMQAFLVQVVLSIHSFWIQSWVVPDVCESGVMKDMKSAIEEVPSELIPSRPPIEVWFAAYYSSTRKLNPMPEDLVSAYLVPSTPWQLRRLLIKSISNDPTRSQMKSLLSVATQSAAVPGPKKASLFTSGPLALISEEPNEKILINEAIAALTSLYASLGEKRFMSAFDRSADAKTAVDAISQGFR